MKPKKILMASLVPFWFRQTGAQQRIFELVRALQAAQHQVKILYPMPESEGDRELADRYALDIDRYTSDRVPQGFRAGVVWYFRAVANQLLVSLKRWAGLKNRSDQSPTRMKLADYRWPWAGVAFSNSVANFQPDVIICQYVKTAYLLDWLSATQRRSVHCMIDTHDLLSRRDEQFSDRGLEHWISITAEEEAQALQKFDTVMAIQPLEAQEMQSMAADARVIVVGHHVGDCEIVREKAVGGQTPTRFSIGYLGSNNGSNANAIEVFLKSVWPQIARGENVELVIAGEICDVVQDRVEGLNSRYAGTVRLLGKIDYVEEFYRAVDIAINPVQFGTGLKIKTVEAISHGIPVVTTEPRGASTMLTECEAVIFCTDLTEMADRLADLLSAGGQAYQKLKAVAVVTAERSNEAAYREILQVIAAL